MDEGDQPYTEEDEHNLLDLLMVLVRHKMLIIGVVLVSGIAAVVISLLMTNIYRSEATIAPRAQEKSAFSSLPALGGLGGMMAEGLGLGAGGSLEKLEVVLKSRNLANRVIEKYKLMPVIFSDLWNKKEKKWNTGSPPTLQDGFDVIRKGLLTVRVDVRKGTVNVAFDHEDPEAAKKFVGYYLTELSETLREEVLRDAAQNKRFFREQIERTIDTLLKEKIYSMLAKEIEKETFAQAQKYYSFLVLDPPIVPDPDKRIKPKRSRICILFVLAALFLAICLAFLKEYIYRIKTEDQERYQEMVQGLKFRNHK